MQQRLIEEAHNTHGIGIPRRQTKRLPVVISTDLDATEAAVLTFEGSTKTDIEAVTGVGEEWIRRVFNLCKDGFE